MEYTVNSETKERILNAALQLFSEKGFDATRVNDIANTANVNKALIYYYFKSKEDILDYMVSSFLENVASMIMDFIHTNVIQMIKKGYLDIKPDRLHFVDDEAIRQFMRNAHIFYEQVIDYAIGHKRVIRVLMFESLKNGKYHNVLFRFMDLTKNSKENPIFKAISDADQDFAYSDDMILFKFFFSIIPLINFAAYFDDYKEVSSLSDEELRSSFLRSFQTITTSMISGRDILLRNNITKV